MKRNLFIVVLSLFTIVFSNTFVFACISYGNNDPACYEYYQSDAVFTGKVKAIENSKITFDVEESFLGIETTEIEIIDSPVCGFGAFEIGEKYLIYAKKIKFITPKDALIVSGTSKIEKFPKAEKDVEELRAFFRKTDASIFGWANVYNKKNRLKTKISVIGENQSYELENDDSGKFSLGDLPLGKYIIKADIPDEFKDNYGDEPKREFLIELRRGECARVDFYAKKKKKFWF